MSQENQKTYRIAIIGGGILGTTLAYFLSQKFRGEEIVVIEQEDDVARHASSRNTGVIHRPFYLDPEKKKKFVACAQESYGFWKAYAAQKQLPWKEVGTIEVALDAAGVERLQQYKQWSLANGMRDDEVQLLTPEAVYAIEPNVRCAGALLCTTDTAVDFGAFTRALRDDATKNGVQFLFGYAVKEIVEKDDGVEIMCQRRIVSPPYRGGVRGGGMEELRAHYIINCAGGNALAIAHSMGLAREYADINFRGEYCIVEGDSAQLATHNIYSVPRHSAFPFLDPHYVVRHDGSVVIGPSATPVFDPYAYRGMGNIWRTLCARPFLNKLRLFSNPEFLTLCAHEWRSALSRGVMLSRVQKFLPDLDVRDCVQRGNAGVRALLIDTTGAFAPEVLEVSSSRSLHILNYNSPGATGAPAYAQLTVQAIS